LSAAFRFGRSAIVVSIGVFYPTFLITHLAKMNIVLMPMGTPKVVFLSLIYRRYKTVVVVVEISTLIMITQLGFGKQFAMLVEVELAGSSILQQLNMIVLAGG